MHYFTDITIQHQVVKRLAESIKRNRLAHAYLFYGPEGSGKEALAFELAKAVNCKDENSRPCNTCGSCKKIQVLNHPDVKYIFPTSKNWKDEEIRDRVKQKAKNPYAGLDLSGHTTIQIDRVRDLKDEAKFTTYEGEKKIYIVSHADKMTRESSNSFLKILEEPPPNLIIILITALTDMLLETIRSRCQLVYFHRLTYEETLSVVSRYQPFSPRIEKIIRVNQGNLSKVFEELDRAEDDKREMMGNYLHMILATDDVQLFGIIDAMYSDRDKNYLMKILLLLILWFRDILHIQLFGPDTEVVYVDHREELVRLARLLPSSGLEDSVQMIDHANRQIQQNIYAPLVLTVLALRIRKILKHS